MIVLSIDGYWLQLLWFRVVPLSESFSIFVRVVRGGTPCRLYVGAGARGVGDIRGCSYALGVFAVGTILFCEFVSRDSFTITSADFSRFFIFSLVVPPALGDPPIVRSGTTFLTALSVPT